MRAERRRNRGKYILVILIVCCASVGLAEDLRTIKGKEYKNATVTRVDADGIVVRTTRGISKLYFAELPDDVQARFGHDPAKIEAETAAAKAAEEKRIDEQKAAKENAESDSKRSLDISQLKSSLDAPAKAPPVTLGSEIHRGYDEIQNADLPWGPEEMKQAADRLVQRNDQLGRNTYGYLLGAHFALWSRLQLAWQHFGNDLQRRDHYDAVAMSVWLKIKLYLVDAGLKLPQLLAALPGEATTVARWEQRHPQDSTASK
jgi:hypothetical protein